MNGADDAGRTRPNLAKEAMGMWHLCLYIGRRTRREPSAVWALLESDMRERPCGDHQQTAIRVCQKHWKFPARQMGDAYALGEGAVGSLRALSEEHPEIPGSLFEEIARMESCHHVGLAMLFANRHSKKIGRDGDDLIGAAWLGLKAALLKYDSRDGAVSTFTHYRIKGSMRDELRKELPVPKWVATFLRKIEVLEEQMTIDLNRAPTDAEIAAELGNKGDLLELRSRMLNMGHLDEIPESLVPGQAHVEDDVENLETARAIAAALSSLEPQEREAVLAYMDHPESPVKAARSASIGVKVYQERLKSGLIALRDKGDLNHLVEDRLE